MSQSFPFSTGTGLPTDAAAASESVSATEIAATKGFWQAMKDDISGRWVWVEDVSGWE